jgi:DNA modification methylase
MTNTLYYGDNLEILQLHIPDEHVDLIYLDPPFNSSQDYNAFFKEKDGSKSVDQIRVFKDTWEWNEASALSYKNVVETASSNISNAMQAFRKFLGDNDMLAYLSMMAPRLIELKRVLKPTGSIFLHCDPTASHYLKMLMDSIFGGGNFRNEIIWHYRTGNLAKKQFQRKHDVILFYSKTKTCKFTPLEYKEYYSQVYGPEFKPSFKGRKHGQDKFGEFRIPFVDDVWDISAVFTRSHEHLDYPTQKPLALLERIIKAGSNKGDLVLDPFCGCGTAVVMAEHLERKWIGIDITHLAVSLIKHRLKDMYEDRVQYQTIGEPTSINGAKVLAKEDPYQFQWWTLGLVGARPVEEKKGADKGIDGRLFFHDEKEKIGKTKQIIISVKSGKVNASHIRDLRGVIEREEAEIGVLITLNPGTKDMHKEAASAGFYTSHWGDHPRIQILTLDQLLNGMGINYPPQTNATFKKAQKLQREYKKTDSLF